MHILVTGGTGYIGSHTIVELAQQGHDVVVVDNLSNSNRVSLERVEHITGKTFPFYQVDCTDRDGLRAVFDAHPIDAVIHFAALKAVGESVSQPLRYYQNNINSSLALCEIMQEKSVRRLIFSSTAAVYGTPAELPLKETSPAGLTIANPYGRSKFIVEQILNDVVTADPTWQITILRYFNPIGAHESGQIGEDPTGVPSNLLPNISQVAVGKREAVQVFGSDYDTPDGTGVRDYIHVVDLAKGHIAALKHPAKKGEVALYNLGTGKGVSVFEMLHAFEKATGQTVPYTLLPRRPSDVAASYADSTKANRELGWKTEKTLEQACADSWRWQSANPNGFNRS